METFTNNNNEHDDEEETFPPLRLWAPLALLQSTSEDVGSLWCPSLGKIPILDEPPSSFVFLRDYVSKSLPCIIRNSILENESVLDQSRRRVPKHLTLDELVDICQEDAVELTVDVTPDGHGDAVRTVLDRNRKKRMFVKPEQRKMSLSEFRDGLRYRQSKHESQRQQHELDQHELQILPLNNGKKTSEGRQDKARAGSIKQSPTVLYYSRQNDCLRTELKPLFERSIFPETCVFAQEAFGTGPPDAVNLWVGDQRAVSSMHKDHYENLFYVLSGEKVFTLCPPCDVPFLYQSDFESGSFHQNSSGEWLVVPDHNNDEDVLRPRSLVKWIEANVECLQKAGSSERYLEEFPLLSLSHPLEVHVKQGEMLYLPSLWFHRVTQTCETVGINYWYDMKFDSPLWCYFNLLQQMQLQERQEYCNSQF